MEKAKARGRFRAKLGWMCGRFTLTYDDRAQLALELGVPERELPRTMAPRYNLAPTDMHFIVRMPREEREVVEARWGLVNHWATPADRPTPLINARAETLDTRPAFREAFERRRCVVPADGFFEWRGPKERREPLWFHRPDRKLVLMAGLYESWQPQPGKRERTFTVITTGANDLMRPIHDRMPAILGEDEVDEWLNPRQTSAAVLKALLAPPPEEMLQFRAVSPLLNSPKNDRAELLEPTGGRFPGL